MTQNTPDPEIDGLLKKQALLAFSGAFVFALIYFAAGLPYRVAAAGAALFAAACYSACNLALTRRITRCAVGNLRAGLEREGAQKEALLRKFSELNSTMQIGVLAHRISHDLRGPMAYISGYVELELAGEKTPDEKEQLKELGETVASMGEILHGITRFGKTSGPSCEKIALGELMRDLLAVAALFPQAEGNAAAIWNCRPAGLVSRRMSICSAIQPSRRAAAEAMRNARHFFPSRALPP